MNIYGWILFIVSNFLVVSLACYCFYNVLVIPKEHMHSPLDIDTRDLDEDNE
jgi:hypothetical protein